MLCYIRYRKITLKKLIQKKVNSEELTNIKHKFIKKRYSEEYLFTIKRLFKTC